MRWKNRERFIVKSLQSALGRVSDPVLERFLSSTGRTGHLTHLGVDGFVGNGQKAFVIEVKNRKQMLAKDIVLALMQLVSKAKEYKRKPILALSFADDVPREIERNWLLVPLSAFVELVGEENESDT